MAENTCHAQAFSPAAPSINVDVRVFNNSTVPSAQQLERLRGWEEKGVRERAARTPRR
jgi:hypothetical protein